MLEGVWLREPTNEQINFLEDFISLIKTYSIVRSLNYLIRHSKRDIFETDKVFLLYFYVQFTCYVLLLGFIYPN